MTVNTHIFFLPIHYGSRLKSLFEKKYKKVSLFFFKSHDKKSDKNTELMNKMGKKLKKTHLK